MDSEYIDEHINLNLVPFGNAGYDPTTKVYTCQHGPQECKINRFQGCIIKYSGGDQRQVFNAIYKEEYAIKHMKRNWMNDSIADLPHPDAVWNCMNSQKSWDVVEEFANETHSLQPPHGWTPWPTINGKPVNGTFTSALCAAFEE
ncbi:Lysosomal thiol, partial [Perkinsus chesapeaki]